MKKMQIFEPALCCDTGVCGASVDPELLRITTVLNTLKQNGVVIDRFNLNSAPMEFVTNQTVNMYVNQKGAEALPCVTVDGVIVIEGRYPTNEEIMRWLELSPVALLPKQSGGCCCGSDTSAGGCSDGNTAEGGCSDGNTAEGGCSDGNTAEGCCSDGNVPEGCCEAPETPTTNNGGGCCCGGGC